MTQTPLPSGHLSRNLSFDVLSFVIYPDERRSACKCATAELISVGWLASVQVLGCERTLKRCGLRLSFCFFGAVPTSQVIQKKVRNRVVRSNCSATPYA